MTVRYFVPCFISLIDRELQPISDRVIAETDRFERNQEILLRTFLSVKYNKQLTYVKLLIEI